MLARRLIVNLLYEIAKVSCIVADWLSPSGDEVWREKQWKQWGADYAKKFEGPPLNLDRPYGGKLDGEQPFPWHMRLRADDE